MRIPTLFDLAVLFCLLPDTLFVSVIPVTVRYRLRWHFWWSIDTWHFDTMLVRVTCNAADSVRGRTPHCLDYATTDHTCEQILRRWRNRNDTASPYLFCSCTVYDFTCDNFGVSYCGDRLFVDILFCYRRRCRQTCRCLTVFGGDMTLFIEHGTTHYLRNYDVGTFYRFHPDVIWRYWHDVR